METNTTKEYGKGQDDPLGKIANTVSQIDNLKLPYNVDSIRENKKNDLRKERFRLQRKAAELLPDTRVSRCLWCIARLDKMIDVIYNHQTKKARFTNLQTCSSVWSCPCCSNYIVEKRREELNTLLAYARKAELFPVMLTLTVKHGKEDNLESLLERLKKAKRSLVRHRAYTTLKPQIIGSVTATEVTVGVANGWHPHFHIILLVKTNTETEAITLIENLRNPWLVSLKAEGLEGAEAAFKVQSAKAAGNYIAKGSWGVAEELILGNKKKGRSGGRTPSQLLVDYADGDIKVGYLFQEYSRVFKGRKQLVWSPGLKALAGIREMSDEKAAADQVRRLEEAKLDEWVKSYGPVMWTFHRHRRVEILEKAEESKRPKPPTSLDFGV